MYFERQSFAFYVFINSRISGKICFICFKKLTKINFKNFYKQVWTSVKKLQKQLKSKVTFRTFLELNCSNFRTKLCEKPQSYQNKLSMKESWGS